MDPLKGIHILTFFSTIQNVKKRVLSPFKTKGWCQSVKPLRLVKKKKLNTFPNKTPRFVLFFGFLFWFILLICPYFPIHFQREGRLSGKEVVVGDNYLYNPRWLLCFLSGKVTFSNSNNHSYCKTSIKCMWEKYLDLLSRKTWTHKK